MDARLDLAALEARRNDLADSKGHGSAAVDDSPAPQVTAVDRYGNDGQPECAVERSETRSQLRCLANADAGTFRIDDHRPACGDRLLPFRDQCAQCLRACRALDRNDAITSG